MLIFTTKLGQKMYSNRRKTLQTQLPLFEFKLPFGGALDPENRWIKIAKLIPWEDVEADYCRHFGDTGNDAYPARMALGALIIKERLKLSDEETVAQISENPYLQYFVGLREYTAKTPFDPSLMVHFRTRITSELLLRINEQMCAPKKKPDKKNDEDEPPSNAGRLIIDATCAPEDIRHPTDVGLLNDAREHTERVIDQLWASEGKKGRKPRTYREKARKQYLQTIRRRNASKSHIRKGIRQQLGFLRRNLKTIKDFCENVSLTVLSRQDYKKLLVASEIYRQQSELYKMFDQKHRRIEDRIVSLSKPHVRPIVRGKTSANVEFGAKVSVSVINGKTYVDRISWDAYNESTDLQKQVESFKARTGSYPESVHADKIYRTRDNRRWCKNNNIRLSGSPLGRPPVEKTERKALLRQQRLDERIRIEIEGRFGTAKRRYGLNLIMTKLRQTSETTIALVFFVMNIDKILRDLLLSLVDWLSKKTPERIIDVYFIAA
jgi:IS5 family transposase